MRLFGFRGATVVDLRKVVRAVDDPIVDYRYHENGTDTLGEVVYHFNSAGFRDVDHSQQKQPGVTRIELVGDSIIEGYGVETEQIFPARVRDRLGDDTELIAIAMSGLNTQQEAHLLEREGLVYEPDLVVLAVSLNDSNPGSSFGAAAAGVRAQESEIQLLKIKIDPRIKRLLLSSALLYTLKQRLEILMVRGRDGTMNDVLARPWAREGNRRRFNSGLDHIATLRDEHDLRVLVMIFPILVGFDAYPYTDVHAWIRSQAEQRGFEVLDLLPAFAELDSHQDVLQDDFDVFHPNALGHDLAAEAFVRWYRNADVGGIGEQLQ